MLVDLSLTQERDSNAVKNERNPGSLKRLPMGWVAWPEEVADVVAFLAATSLGLAQSFGRGHRADLGFAMASEAATPDLLASDGD